MRLRQLLLVPIVVGLVVGCASPQESVVRESASVVTSAKPEVPFKLRFTAKTLDGADFAGESLAGKPAVLWFWAPWCEYCKGDAELVAKVAKASVGKVTFVGVAGKDDLEPMKKFVADHKMDGFPHLADLDGELFKRSRVSGTPTLVFFSADGKTDVHYGSIEERELTKKVRDLVE
ncbi:thiol-disulfide isomerase/thioredoxin [Kibdelosporangium banguiense]|uniref:Thiol-disulfide isomerase/thioredoxin n=1 Tax=Kibdelosporangium banguiense TaxID=1365924 RepID=A0ABS4TGN3_9PSEU|nr:redoxin domain-containing protein [Kibdelosporangium banguiense]MBP2323575.1 thiol-disulfide isomerase/thioredoxin [Kibdelosporangium banguiense]